MERGLRFTGFTSEEKSSVEYVISDVDDTITANGRLLPVALNALWSLSEAGKKIILVTGGSAGWADTYIRQWPVDAVIAESGALMLTRDEKSNVCYKINPYIDLESTKLLRKSFMAYTAGLPFSSDQYARMFDMAYDKSHLSKEEIALLKKMAQAFGASYSESSIHINVWYGIYSKQSAIIEFMSKDFGVDFETLRSHSIYFGDSLNDQEVFEAIPLTVGMHSVEDRRADFKTLPLYISDKYGGFGFADAVDNLLNITV